MWEARLSSRTTNARQRLYRHPLFHEILRVRKLAFVEVHVSLRGRDVGVPRMMICGGITKEQAERVKKRWSPARRHFRRSRSKRTIRQRQIWT